MSEIDDLKRIAVLSEKAGDTRGALEALRRLDSLQTRADVAKGATLKVGPLDTGVEIPQEVFEALAGMGRRFSEIGTLGTHQAPEAAAELLDQSGYATAGGAAADLTTMLGGGALLKGASAIPKIGSLLGKAGQAISAPKTLAQASTAMGAYGAATSPDRIAGGAGGLIGGGLGYGVPKALGAIVKPSIQKGAAMLKAKGVPTTPGEMLGGAAQRAEDAMTSIPVMGDMIRKAKGRSIAGYNKATINDALDIIGEKLDDSIPMGREAIAQADDVISARYDDILDNMPIKMDNALRGTLAKIRSMVDDIDFKGDKARIFDNDILGPINKYTDNPKKTMLGRTYKEVSRQIRENYKKWRGSGDMITNKIGDAAREVHKALLDAAKRQNPKMAPKLQKTDAAFAAMSRVREAASALGGEPGMFTPSQMLGAIRNQAKGTKKFGRGEAYGQEFAEAVKSTLPSKVPDSGTPFRTAAGLLGAGALYGGGEAVDSPLMSGAGAGLLGGTALYSPAGQALMRSMLSRPAWMAYVRKALEKGAAPTSLLGAAGGMQVAQ